MTRNSRMGARYPGPDLSRERHASQEFGRFPDDSAGVRVLRSRVGGRDRGLLFRELSECIVWEWLILLRVNLAASVISVSVLQVLLPTGHPFPSASQGLVRFLPSLGLDRATCLTLSWVCVFAGVRVQVRPCVLGLFWGLASHLVFVLT